MDIIAQCKHYLMPAAVSVVAIGLLKIGLFVTHGDLEQSLRRLESGIRAEYATKQDIQDIKSLLHRLDLQLSRMDERLDRALPPGAARH
jgi:hypothetical protein